MTNTVKHTPLPWKKNSPFERHSDCTINIYQASKSLNDKRTLSVAEVYYFLPKRGIEEAEANANFIVKACNSYYETTAERERLKETNAELLVAAEQVISDRKETENQFSGTLLPIRNSTLDSLEQAIAKAKEGK